MSRNPLRILFASLVFVCPAFSQAPRSPGQHTAILNGVHLWYEIAGAEQPGQAPVLYLSGGPGYNSYSFEHTIGPRLQRHAEMIYFDERGTGRSERPPNRDYTMPALVQDVEALREHLGVPQLALMGHSFGGTIALEYAARYPEHVQKLILVDAAADLTATFRLWQGEIEARYPAAWKAAMSGEHGKAFQQSGAEADECALTQARFQREMDTLAKVDSPKFHHWQQFHNGKYRREQDALDSESGLRNTGEMNQVYFAPGSPFLCYRFTAYARLSMPVLVVAGMYDNAIGIRQLAALAKHISGAKLDLFRQSAHFPYAEQPAKFERDITAFLERHPPPAP